MTKTICDRCGKEIHYFPVQIQTGMFFKTHTADLCKECYKELLNWIERKAKDERKSIK